MIRTVSWMSGAALGLALATSASAVTMQFDVGRADTAGNINGITWNAQDVANAIDTTGAATGVSLTVTSATGFNEVGPNDSGTAAPGAPASGFFDGETTNDALFGHSSNFNVGGPRALVEYTIAGLNPASTYDFTYYASRGTVSDNREASYDANGTVALLDAGNNVSNIAQSLGVAPTAGGVITLTIQAGPNNTNSQGFFYLGGMDITEVPEPASLTLLGLGGLAMLRRR